MDDEIEENENIEGDKDAISNEGLKKVQNKQIMWAVILMLSVILVVVVTPHISSILFRKFHYINLEFEKTKLGEVMFYSTQVPLTNAAPITGAFIGKDKITGTFSVDLRNDPRELEYIPVNISNNTINFKSGTVYITMNSYDKPCEQNVIAAVTLTNFLIDFGNLDVSGAVTDENYSEENGVPYVTCNNSQHNTVIYIKEGNETRIDKISPTCYELTYTDCEMLPVSEKFILEILKGYMSFFEGGENLNQPII